MIENKTAADYGSETSFYDNCVNGYYECELLVEDIICDLNDEKNEEDRVSESAFCDRCINGEYKFNLID